MTTEVYFKELGYLTEFECKKIQSVMQGKTYMNFDVSYSNYAGNCTLIASTDYDASEQDIKAFFLSALVRLLILCES